MRRDWLVLLAGPFAWSVAALAGWMLAPPAYEKNHTVITITAINISALAIAGVAAVMAFRRVRALRSEDEAKFLAVGGLALATLSIILTIGLILPPLLLAPGAEP